MKNYTTSRPEFSDTIKILEVGDPGHADNVNVTTMQLLANTLANRILLEALIQMVAGCNYDAQDEMIDMGLGCSVNEEILMIPPEIGSWESEMVTLNHGLMQMLSQPSGGVISGGNAGYRLPPATAQRLGGVRIGQGLDVDSDGTISVNVDTSAEKAAALVEAGIKEFSNEEIQSLFTDGLTPLA